MISVHSYSEPGGDHGANEDAFCVQSHPHDAECWLCFVADGQGGRAGGAQAARLACETALAYAVRYRPRELIDPAAWEGIVRQADATVAGDPVAGFTTLVGLCVYRDRLIGASSGDSAALLFSGGKTNELTARQRKNPPVGSGAAVGVLFAAALQEPWRALVISDGVWKYVGWDRVNEIASRARAVDVIAELQNSARLAGSGQFQDDFTVVMLEATAKTDAAVISP
jgi:serine/threonine protein phosphatase PrpC